MAKTRKKNAGGRFALGMAIYALAFILFLAIGLRIFWGYIDNFEKSQPSHAIDRYIQSFDSNHIRALSADFVSSLDSTLQSQEDAYREIENLFKDLHYSKKGAESTEEHLVYAILAGDRYLGSMTLDATGETGDDSWRVTSESFDFSDLISEQSFVVPAEWTVSCNGNILGEAYITEKGIRYPSMEDAYDYGFALPTLVRYELGNYIGSPEIRVVDADGNAAEIQNDPTAYPLRLCRTRITTPMTTMRACIPICCRAAIWRPAFTARSPDRHTATARETICMISLCMGCSISAAARS